MANDKIRQKLADLPETSGVYIMRSEAGQILYIGKARNLKRRVRQYFADGGSKTEKVVKLVEKIEDFEYILTRNEIEALVLENNLIKKHKPPYNILLKDDKSYPFIRIDTRARYPRVEITRKLRNDGAKYFGPYMLGIGGREILDLINAAFSLRTCNLNFGGAAPKVKRPCLNYFIKRCGAPCMGYISEEEYKERINKVVAFLGGNDKSVAALLTERMNEASEREDYEQALFYKRKLEVLSKLVRAQVTALPKDFDLDIFAIASNGMNTAVAVLFVRGGKLVGGDKRTVTGTFLSDEIALSNFIVSYYDTVNYIAGEVVTSVELEDRDVVAEYLSERKGSRVNVLMPKQGVRRQLADMASGNAADFLEKSVNKREREENLTVGGVIQMQELLRLKRLPSRMECYDISHVQGTDKVASMVVFSNGVPLKAHYRKFKIKTVAGNDDFASLMETLTRRISRLNDPEEQDDSFAARPDLIVIDGGKGQLSSVLRALENFDCAGTEIVSLAKREEEVFKPHCSEPVVLPRNSYALRLLQRIRDEAHRFAVTFHRQQRKSRQTHSKLLDIEGVGAVRAKELMAAFRTMENIRAASVDELMAVKHMTLPAAQSIYRHFHPAPSPGSAAEKGAPGGDSD